MPKGFTKSFAERLDAECGPHVVEAQDGMLVEPNTVYLAPGDYHMTTDGVKIYLNQTCSRLSVQKRSQGLSQSSGRGHLDRHGP